MSTREEKQPTRVISLRLTSEELIKVKSLAKKLKLTVSEVIRQAVLSK